MMRRPAGRGILILGLTGLFSLECPAIGLLSVEGRLEGMDAKSVTLILKDQRKIRVPKDRFTESEQRSFRMNTPVVVSLDEKEIPGLTVISKNPGK